MQAFLVSSLIIGLSFLASELILTLTKTSSFLKVYDADLTIVDLNKEIIIKNENIASKSGWSPFNGMKLKGSPVAAIINGSIKMIEGKVLEKPNGKVIDFD